MESLADTTLVCGLARAEADHACYQANHPLAPPWPVTEHLNSLVNGTFEAPTDLPGAWPAARG